MNSSRARELAGGLSLPFLCAVLFIATEQAQGALTQSTSGVRLWDTAAHLGDQFTGDRSKWKAVPNDLLLLEKDPLKASSDPGYYGREYTFEGHAVVETPSVAAVFWSAKGCVTIYSKQGPPDGAQLSEPASWKKIVDVCPAIPDNGPVTISRNEVVRHANDQIAMRATFSRGSKNAEGLFVFDKTGIVEIKPGAGLNQVRLGSTLAYGVVPAFVGDDLIFGGAERPTNNTVCIPAENMFLALLEGENTEFFLTWPNGKQRLGLVFGEGQATNTITSVDFNTDGQSFYLTALSASGIWHRENLTADFLEKDVKSSWKRPFPARWKTQLLEEETKTTFAFRPLKGSIWRGVAGSYDYPVWFSEEDAFYRLGKKVQPKGESIVYFLEGRDTPATILTPADILNQTLGRQAAGEILDVAGRQLRTHHRRGASGVRRACTCGCTEAIQAVFEARQEVDRKDYIQGALEDMIYFVHRHVERINEYRAFADEVLKKVEQARRPTPNLNPFLDTLDEIVRQIPQECEVQKQHMKSFEYADELTKKTLALASKADTNNVKAYLELLKAWRDMGGAQDSVVAKCHIVARSLAQAAGYGCGTLPAALPLAEEIRAACRRTLRNPDGYEVWADY